MKNILLFAILLSFTLLNAQGIGVNEDGSAPDASAILDVKSTEKGFLPPRLSTSARDAINNPSEGLMIFNTDVKCLQWYVGNGIWHDGCGDNLYQEYPQGTIFCNSGPTEIVEVLNPLTNKTWMDRNLGASRVTQTPRSDYSDNAAYTQAEEESFGDLYQWGRAADGHQCRTSSIHNGSQVANRPNNITDTGAWDGKFIRINSGTNRNDWVTSKTDNAWNTGTQANPVKTSTDPCPNGFRLPTEAELSAERTSWSSNNPAGAFNSPLKFPLGGQRIGGTGAIGGLGTRGDYWTSTISGDAAQALLIQNFSIITNINRVNGNHVRCIKE